MSLECHIGILWRPLESHWNVTHECHIGGHWNVIGISLECHTHIWNAIDVLLGVYRDFILILLFSVRGMLCVFAQGLSICILQVSLSFYLFFLFTQSLRQIRILFFIEELIFFMPILFFLSSRLLKSLNELLMSSWMINW